ncbi:MAG: type III polyketide synthase [Planctomycetes bacterium]|nr:type III polyketide synthase [Planctomycetota bacterium]
MARIRSVATALPPHRVDQATAREVCRKLLGDHELLDVFDRAGVETRYFAFPPEYYMSGRGFQERNKDYIEQAMLLGERAARGALEKAGVSPGDIDVFLFVTTTGLATPSLDALLAQRMRMRSDVIRMPLFGIGCAGGAAMIARAADMLRARPEHRVLALSVELCGQTFRIRDHSPENTIGAALFADGAAAAVIDGQAHAGPEIVATGRELFPDTEHVMGWRFANDGMSLVLTIEVPEVIATRVAPALDRFLVKQKVAWQDIRHFVLHPGGRKVLETYQSAMGLSADQLRPSRESLRSVGNVSSAAVLFVLAGIEAAPGDLGLLAAVGPGFAVEHVLLRW